MTALAAHNSLWSLQIFASAGVNVSLARTVFQSMSKMLVFSMLVFCSAGIQTILWIDSTNESSLIVLVNTNLAIFATALFLEAYKLVFRRGNTWCRFGAWSLSFGLCVGFVTGEVATGWMSKRAMKTGDVIVQAISAYHKENDEIPASLGLLVPDFMARIPDTGVGVFVENRFHFWPGPNRGEVGQEHVLHFYTPGGGGWQRTVTEGWTQANSN